MQVQAIQQKTSYNTSTKKSTTFKGVVSNSSPLFSSVDTLTLKALTNKKIKSAYKKFVKFYTKENQNDIPKAFIACLNSDGSLSRYALYTLNGFFTGVYPEFWKNVKSLFNNKELYEFEEYDLKYGHALNKAADIINACKDKNNNHNETNLKFAQRIFLETDLDKTRIPQVINSLKNEDGICSPENIEMFNILKDIYSNETLIQIINSMAKDGRIITDSAKNFVLKLNNKNSYQYILNVLNNTNTPDRDKILDFISNSEFLSNELPPVAYYQDKTENINLDYLKKYVSIFEEFKPLKSFEVRPEIYQSNDAGIRDKNIEQIVRFAQNGYKQDRIDRLSKSEFFKQNGSINKDFIDFILIRLSTMFSNNDTYRIYPFLDTSIKSAIDKNKIINWDIAEMLEKFGYGYYHYNTNDKQIKRMIQQAAELCKDKDGIFLNDNIIETKKDLKYIEDNCYRKEDLPKGIKYLNQKYLSHLMESKNIYNAEDMLEILEKSDVTKDLLTTPIREYENLIMIISDIPSDNNKEAYKKILQKIDKVDGLGFNHKDSHGISFIEKIINSENKQLLLLVSHPSKPKIEYQPELEYAYNNIQNREFKRLVDNELSLKFPMLEEAAKLGSTKAFEKVEQQLNSPLCHRKEVLEHLWHIASSQLNNKEFCNYFVQRFTKELPNSIINDLNKI